jgi:hypothetical protein
VLVPRARRQLVVYAPLAATFTVWCSQRLLRGARRLTVTRSLPAAGESRPVTVIPPGLRRVRRLVVTVSVLGRPASPPLVLARRLDAPPSR